MKHFEDWRTSATDIPEGRSGRVRLEHRAVKELQRPYWFDPKGVCVVSGTLTYLTEGTTEWMVDDPTRRRVMELYAQQAEGRVLVGGLGLGLLQHELKRNPRVRYVATIERSADVISLIPGGFIRGDFWVEAALPGNWNTIIADLWDDNAAERLPELELEVAIMASKIREANPQAKLIIHGFPTLSDYDPLHP